MASILLVEDEPLLAAAVERGLRDDHHDVTVAGDGAVALRLGSSATFDLLVLDLMLPGLPGLAVCERLRERGATVPILMLTAKDATADVVAGLDAGADDYLTKPFAFPVLQARVRTLLRRSRGSLGPRVRAGPIELDTGQRKAWFEGREVALTAKEFGILDLLARGRGRVLSKRTIGRALWPDEREIDSNVIEVHVASLRRKLDRRRGSLLLQTVRGVGYVIRADDDA